jgi:hypothetical protein
MRQQCGFPAELSIAVLAFMFCRVQGLYDIV